jgi:predicted ester cyclase
MSIETNKTVARRLWEEVINQRRLELFEEIIAADAVDETGNTPGREGFYEHGQWFIETIDQLRTTVTDMVAEGDRVIVFWTAEGIQRGPLYGVPPTGRPFTLHAISWITFRDGQIARYNVLPDRLGVIEQLGGEG